MKKTINTFLSFMCILILIPHFFCGNWNDLDNGNSFSSRQLKGIAESLINDKNNILGTIIKVDIQGKKSYAAACGYTDPSRSVPLSDPDTKFIIGSVTKIFTAVLVHQLIEKGIVDLNDPLINYLPSEWAAILKKIDYGSEITVEQALGHRTGIGDMTESEEFHESLLLGPYKKQKGIDYLRLVQEKRRTKFKPGESYDYCNTNYILLGALIENVSGISYEESLKKNILEKIGLDNTFLIEETLGSYNDTIAHGYSRIEDKLYDGSEMSLEWAQAAGGIVSNANDLMKFYRELESGNLFNNKKTYEQMSQLYSNNESYGLGVEIVNDPDIGLYYGHGGSLLNTRTRLAYFPKKKMILCICCTYDGFSMSSPEDLLKLVVLNMMGDVPTEDTDIVFEGPDILADTSNVLENEDIPIYGEWDFALKEEWSLNRVEAHPLIIPGNLHAGDKEELYLLDYGSAKITVLDSDGNLLYSFGGHGDGPLFEYPIDMFVTSERIHVLDMGNKEDKIKIYDKNGHYIKTVKIEKGISPRVFIDSDQFVAIRSGSDILNRPENELLELMSLEEKKGSILARFLAEDKIILTANLPMGRYIFLQDDIELFPRIIIHFDKSKNMLYLGRSDKYLIKKFDLSGKEQMAFSIMGRKKRVLPPDYAVNQADKTRIAGDQEMPEEMRVKFLSQFPQSQTSYTKITTDKQGLIYVYIPDIFDLGKQEIDIFSPEGKYIYHSIVKLPQGIEKIRPIVFSGEHLYVLAKTQDDENRLIKYKIKKPVFQTERKQDEF